MVVTFFPAAAETGMLQERTGAPSRCTVQAPHWAMPQPNLVPVSPSSSRITHNSGVSADCSDFTALPFTVKLSIPTSPFFRNAHAMPAMRKCHAAAPQGALGRRTKNPDLRYLDDSLFHTPAGG